MQIWKKDNAEAKEKGIAIAGETVSFENVFNYFNEAWRSQDIHAMLDHREAASIAMQNKHHDYHWVIPIGIFLVTAAIAAYLAYGFFGPQGTSAATAAATEAPKVLGATMG